MKKTLLIVGVVGLVGLVGFLLFAGSTEQNDPIVQDTPQPTHAAAPSQQPTATPVATPVETAAPAEVTSEDISEAILSVEDDAELAFLTPEQKKELTAASIGTNEARARLEQVYTVSWKDTDLIGKMPTLPEEAPVYLLDRPTNADVFDVVKSIADAFGIEGTVIRTDQQNYAVANIMTGDYYLYYDLFHLTFDAEWLEIPVENSIEGVQAALQDAGLLNFPVTTTEDEDEYYFWYRFTPDLALPIVSMETPGDDSVFEPGKVGTIDVAVTEDDTIQEIKSGFPNIKETDTVALADTATLSEKFAAGSFRLGSVDLQYPGALPLEDKRAFFELSGANAISISDAEISDVECGYFVETEENLQALFAPVCIANGQGRVDSYSVLFRVVVPATE